MAFPGKILQLIFYTIVFQNFIIVVYINSGFFKLAEDAVFR